MCYLRSCHCGPKPRSLLLFGRSRQMLANARCAYRRPKGWQTVAVRHQQLLTFDRRRIFDANYLRIRSFSDLRLSGAAREPA